MKSTPQGLRFRKSTFSVSGNCVEVAAADGTIYVRDSKAPSGPALSFTRSEWTAFIQGMNNGEFLLSALEA